MRECAYARAFWSSRRAAALSRCLHLYNVHRPHTALAGHPPISRLVMNNMASSRDGLWHTSGLARSKMQNLIEG
jgi:hypothetical protein